MRKRKCRALAVLLAALVFVTALTATAFADEWTGKDPINISWGEDVEDESATPSTPVEPRSLPGLPL